MKSVIYILYEAKAAWSELSFVQAHHNSLYFADLGKKLPDLLLPRVEGQVTDVDCAGCIKSVLVLFGSPLPISTSVGAVARWACIKMGHFATGGGDSREFRRSPYEYPRIREVWDLLRWSAEVALR